MKKVLVTVENGVAVLKLNNGRGNTITPELLTDLQDAWQWAESDPQVTAVVLTGREDGLFSMGFDLPTIVQMSEPEFRKFFSAFNDFCLTLFATPKPTIAAITGHAVAGGCILACCTDYRFIASGKTLMGMNEIKLGIPLPYTIDRICAFYLGEPKARRVADSGDFYSPFQLLHLGMVDQVYPRDMVLRQAVAFVRQIAETSAPAFRMIKQNRVEPVLAQIRNFRRQRDEEFIDRWFSHEVQERLKGALKKFRD